MRNNSYYEWALVENEFKIENNFKNETLFTVGNGYLGMRGAPEEGYTGPEGTGHDGTYINGFYESEPIRYGEIAYGYAKNSQTMMNVANSKIIKLYVEDEEFDMLKGTVSDYSRVLDIKDGILRRSLIWTSPKGKKVKIYVERLASFTDKHLAAVHYEVTPINFSGSIKLVSAIDGDVTNLVSKDDPRVGAGFYGRVLSVEEKAVDGELLILVQKTKNTGFKLACAAKNRITSECSFSVEDVSGEYSAGCIYYVDGEIGKSIILDKFIAYATSRDNLSESILDYVKKTVNNAELKGFEAIRGEQSDFLKDFWYRADVEIKGDPALQQGIRFNMFHLLQSVGRDGNTNIAAKGITGEGYEGHYFWDTETYILPFFLYINPNISRKLLEYRYRTLDTARERAREMAHKRGALFPWRTINGEECSAYYPGGTAQYHIDADIAFAVKRYMEATVDMDFMVNYGAEILFETARLWADLGEFIESKGGKFCINEVTGPDEYTALVNNNCYTNLMARENLLYAYEIAEWMKQNANEAFQKIAAKIGLMDEEISFWKKAGDNMYIPYDEKLGIYKQDDSFLDKAPWDFENTPKENYPLLMHYHPLVIYRHQVCKQADLILAEFMLSHKFTKEQKKKDYDFYEKVTTHDSSLSHCIFSIAASEVGYYDKAYRYFINTARMDIDDYHGNTKDGIHTANMAGAWMCITNGFGGMRVYDGVIEFSPYLPEKWDEYSFRITYQNRLIHVKVNKEGTSYELLEGENLTIVHRGEKLLLKKGEIQIKR